MKTIWFDYDEYGLEAFVRERCQKIKGNMVSEVFADEDDRGFVKGLISSQRYDVIKYKNVRYDEIYLTIKDDIIFYDTEGDKGIIFVDNKENDMDVRLQKLPEDRECDHGKEGLKIINKRNVDLGVREKLSNNEMRGVNESVIDYHEAYIEEKGDDYALEVYANKEGKPDFIMMDCFYNCISLLKSGDILLYSSSTDTVAILKKTVVCVVH
jgi:hypothetical protein